MLTLRSGSSLRRPARTGAALLMTAALLLAAFSFLINQSFIVSADTAAQTLPFAQNWTNTALISANDNWSSVPGITGYRGDDLTTQTGVNPQTILADGANTPVNVIANQTAPNTLATGGVAEFEIVNPAVALNGSGTADAPHLVISLNTLGQTNLSVSYNLRDLDASIDNAVQPVALQYRVGGAGNYTNLPAGFVADATTGPNLATLVTSVSVLLPAAAENQPLVQLRIMTTNAAGNDEWVGIDDILVTGNGGSTINLSAVAAANPSQVNAGDSTLLTVAVTPASNPPSTNITVTGNLTALGGSNSQQFFDDGTNGDMTPGDNVFSYRTQIPGNAAGGARSFTATVTDAQSRTATANGSVTVVAVVDPLVHLTLGNPSNAVTDAAQPNNYLLLKPQYAVGYNRDAGRPNWVSWQLDSGWLGGAGRQDDFRNDTTLPPGFYQVQGTDYSGSGFDRGHHTPSADRTATIPDNSATFLMTNMMPQAPDNNQGPWEDLESYSRTLVNQGNELYIVAGGAGIGGVGSNGYRTTIAGGRVTVPAFTWKVILVLPRGENDVARVTTSTRTIVVIMPNTQGIRNDNWQQYVTSVDRVEALTGYDLFSNVEDSVEAVIEARVDGQTAPISNGRLAFVSDGGGGTGNNEIYSVNPDGSDLRRLTDNPTSDSGPTYSPDGGKLLFVRNNEIFVMNADGSNQTQLTNSGGTSGFPVWAPFGNRIAFLRFEGEDAVSDIFVMNPNGSNQVNVTNTPNIDEYYPTFAPDGSRLAFERYGNGSFEIYAVNFDGGNLLNLTSSPAFEERPVWSPDGSKIAYERFEYGGSPQVFVMNQDGSNQRQVSDETWESRRPRWSPDGSQIAYMGYTYDPGTRALSTYDIYLAQTDGSGVRRVRETPDGYDYDPIWSPDGSKIAYFQFGSTQPGAGISVTKADGSSVPVSVSSGLPVRYFDLTWQAVR